MRYKVLPHLEVHRPHQERGYWEGYAHQVPLENNHQTTDIEESLIAKFSILPLQVSQPRTLPILPPKALEPSFYALLESKIYMWILTFMYHKPKCLLLSARQFD